MDTTLLHIDFFFLTDHFLRKSDKILGFGSSVLSRSSCSFSLLHHIAEGNNYQTRMLLMVLVSLSQMECTIQISLSHNPPPCMDCSDFKVDLSVIKWRSKSFVLVVKSIFSLVQRNANFDKIIPGPRLLKFGCPYKFCYSVDLNVCNNCLL